jgi:hypothetical protein
MRFVERPFANADAAARKDRRDKADMRQRHGNVAF